MKQLEYNSNILFGKMLRTRDALSDHIYVACNKGQRFCYFVKLKTSSCILYIFSAWFSLANPEVVRCSMAGSNCFSTHQMPRFNKRITKFVDIRH